MEKPEIILCFDNVRSVQNVATLFRVMNCVGITTCVLGGITPGPYDRFGRVRNDFAKIALGAEKTITYSRVDSLVSYLRKKKKEGYDVVCLEQSQKSMVYTKYRITKPTCIVIGAEVDGVSDALLKMSDACLEIPMSGSKESLNVAIATSVLLFSLRDS